MYDMQRVFDSEFVAQVQTCEASTCSQSVWMLVNRLLQQYLGALHRSMTKAIMV